MDLTSPGAGAPALLERLHRRRSSGVARSHGEDRGPRERLEIDAPLPESADQLASLLDVCFFATMLAEEGRPTRFAAAYRSPDGLDGTPARRLARPLPVHPGNDPAPCAGQRSRTDLPRHLADRRRSLRLGPSGCAPPALPSDLRDRYRAAPGDVLPPDPDDLRPRRRERPTRTRPKLPDVNPVDRRRDGSRPASVVSAAGVAWSRRRPHPGGPWRGHPRVKAAA